MNGTNKIQRRKLRKTLCLSDEAANTGRRLAQEQRRSFSNLVEILIEEEGKRARGEAVSTVA